MARMSKGSAAAADKYNMNNAATTHPATVTNEGETFVTITTDAGAAYKLHYYAVPSKYGVGDAVALTVEPAGQYGGPGAAYVAA